MIIVCSFSGIASNTFNQPDISSSRGNQEEKDTEITINIYTLSGVETRKVLIESEFLKNIGQPSAIPSYEELLAFLSEKDQKYVKQKILADKEKISGMVSKSNVLKNRIYNDRIENMDDKSIDNYFVNYLCRVQGWGLLMFPVFLPVTPILWAGLLFLETKGIMGEYTIEFDQAIMIPFIGLSLWLVDTIYFGGYAAVAIGINSANT